VPSHAASHHLQALVRRRHATLLPGIVGGNDQNLIDEIRITHGTNNLCVPIVEWVKRSPENADAGSRHG
jgi:hypothetical protein